MTKQVPHDAHVQHCKWSQMFHNCAGSLFTEHGAREPDHTILATLLFPHTMQYCSLQHQSLLSPPATITAEHYFCFGPATSFFLELFVIVFHSFPVVSWSCSVVSNPSWPHGLAHQAPPSMEFSRQEYWSRVPLPSPLNANGQLSLQNLTLENMVDWSTQIPWARGL